MKFLLPKDHVSFHICLVLDIWNCLIQHYIDFIVQKKKTTGLNDCFLFTVNVKTRNILHAIYVYFPYKTFVR